MADYNKEAYRRALRLATRFILIHDPEGHVRKTLTAHPQWASDYEQLLLDTINNLLNENNADARETRAPAQTDQLDIDDIIDKTQTDTDGPNGYHRPE